MRKSPAPRLLKPSSVRAVWKKDKQEIVMPHYVMVGEGKYPIAAVKKTHREHLKKNTWLDGTYRPGSDPSNPLSENRIASQ